MAQWTATKRRCGLADEMERGRLLDSEAGCAGANVEFIPAPQSGGTGAGR
ncbi:hypothetical protein MRQ86_00180 [Streptomyces sp. MMS21 TC-5]|nr:hypothetical protein [Streptomyces sp. MMS21 TC-5]MCI4078796.1 hypothetical protein [Streptomyces sp. MMS21 TC-5]